MNFNFFVASGGVERVERVVTRYNSWIENYGQEYKKTPKLTRAVERLRKYVSTTEQQLLQQSLQTLQPI